MQNPSTEDQTKVLNGMSEAILGFRAGVPGLSQQVTQVDTVFENLRFYLISNMRQPLNQAYAEIGIVRNVCDVPVDDALRGGIDIKTKLLSPENLSDLQTKIDQENDLGVLAQSLKWNRLFGGAGVIIMNGDDWEEPLDISKLPKGEAVHFRAVDLWELFYDVQNLEGDGNPNHNEDFEYYHYYTHNVHKSRVMVTRGIEAPSFVRPRLRGWGLSILETMMMSINQYLKSIDLAFEVLDEFKLDVFRMKGLNTSAMSPQGTEQIRKRIQIANEGKNFQKALVLDIDDAYEQRELNFSGLAGVMSEIRMQLAADLRMPMSKIFGIPSTGFSSGEDDLEVYCGMVESTIRTPSKFHLINLVKIRCMELFGFIPDDLNIGFKPLRTLSAEQEQNVKTQIFNRVLALRQAGEITSLELRDACNKDELVPLPLENDASTLSQLEDEKEQNKDQDPDKAQPASKFKKSATEAKDAKV
jgi:phage-related protein (TIGR01555 family)